jgi:hypothetical protein
MTGEEMIRYIQENDKSYKDKDMSSYSDNHVKAIYIITESKVEENKKK